MFKYEIFEEFVPEFYQSTLLSHALFGNVGWKYNKNISGVNTNAETIGGLKVCKNQGGFSRDIYIKDKDSETDQTMFGMTLPLIRRLEEILPIKFSVKRIRIGLYTFSEEGIHIPHVDYYEPHYTLLYYVNDSDGDTVIFNEMSTNGEPSYPDSLSVMETISPKMGRAILFNGNLYHSSTPPKINYERIAININIFPVD